MTLSNQFLAAACALAAALPFPSPAQQTAMGIDGQYAFLSSAGKLTATVSQFGQGIPSAVEARLAGRTRAANSK